ncbi:MAG: hypothetical protein ACI8ZB_001592 [Desulforhopalus sp.]|jgi:hypothetical protein
MPLPNNPHNTPSTITLLFLLLPVVFSGCAQKPWDTSLGEKEYEAGLQIATEMSVRNTQCIKGLTSDITLEYSNPLTKRTFSGFLQYSPIANYSFVASNPLGQPVLIIAGNQKKYEIINTLESKYMAGGMTSFALRYKLPIHFLKGRWDDWFTGKNTIPTEYITNISSDKELRGIWLTFEDNKGVRNISHLLVDPKQKVILEHVLETRQKKPLATIKYSQYFADHSCMQPQHINISGLEYGTTIDLQLSETELTTNITTYKLTPPKNYLRQFRP